VGWFLVLVCLSVVFLVQDGQSFMSNNPDQLNAVVATCRRLFDVEDELRESRSRQYNRLRPATLVAEPLPLGSSFCPWPSIILLLFRSLFLLCFLFEPIGCSRASVQCGAEWFGRDHERERERERERARGIESERGSYRQRGIERERGRERGGEG
jgi:hypothetical protein